MPERRGRPPKTFKSAVKKYQNQPNLWLEDVFGVELWEKQEEIVNTVWNNRYTAVKSCFASGKSFVAACIAIAFVHLFPDSIVVTTAPSYRQLENIWATVHKLKEKAKADLGSTFLKHEIRCGPGHQAIGFTTNMPERLQGIHAPHLLIIVDESAGIEPEINERLDALMTGDGCHRFDIGNPLSPEGHFYEMFDDPRYATLTISAFDTPNLKAGEEIIPGLVTEMWVDERRELYGVGSPRWVSEVEGQFPPTTEEGLIPLTWIKRAQHLWENTTPPTDYEPIFGFDPSGGGMDDNCLVKRIANYVELPINWTVASLPETIDNLQANIPAHEQVYTDTVGVGWAVHERMLEANMNSIAINAQSSPVYDPEERFLNLRAELYWQLRERLNPEKADSLALPPDDDLATQLSNMKYDTTAKGKIKIESKEDMKKRGLSSPDEADALMLTMAGEFMDSSPISAGLTEVEEQLAQYSEFSYQAIDSFMKHSKWGGETLHDRY